MIETMPAELAENLIDFCENRSRVYALLSRCYETEIDAAFAEALASKKPAWIECVIDKDEKVLPMIPAAGNVEDIMMS